MKNRSMGQLGNISIDGVALSVLMSPPMTLSGDRRKKEDGHDDDRTRLSLGGVPKASAKKGLPAHC